MPEGPSIVILREQASAFAGKKILAVTGNTRLDKERLVGKKVVALRSWGKHFLIELRDFSVRVHFLIFGSYLINERKETAPRLSLSFANGELNFYACSIKFVEGKLDDTYDWRVDVMSDEWDAELALEKLRAMPDTLACDAILDQDVFAGAGNIFKNEVLFRIRVHPLSTLGAVPDAKLRELVKGVRDYAFDFLKWKKAFVLRQHWQAHTKTTCPRCDIPFSKGYIGKTHRRSFFCERCQQRYVTEETQGKLPLAKPATRSRKKTAAHAA